ncbi:MAG: hypothetical protein JO099_20990, partial [Acidobacteriia bacterium]|nr:hypothetical protein [Terriglobia bacterium]
MTASYSLLAGLALKSVIVLAAAGLVAVALRRSSAAVRHSVWTAAFTGLVALPALTLFLPALPWVQELSPNVVFRAVARGSGGQTTRSVGARPQPAARSVRDENRNLLASTARTVSALWGAGTLLSLIEMAVGWLMATRMRRRARPLSEFDAGVPIFETAPGSMPVTFGLRRPAIFLPADANEWPHERRSMVLLHEMAHVRRGDAATHLLARFALSLYWWNPLAWFAWREFVRERERAADDIVLNQGARPSDYAGHLLDIARGLQSAPAIGCAAVAMARRSQLEARLRAILGSHVNRRAPRAAAWLIGAAAILLLVPLAAVRAQNAETVPADLDATIRAAQSQKNYNMLESAAKAAEAFRQYDLARKLSDSALAIREEESGPQSITYGLGLIKIGDLERGRRNFEEAEAFYAKAISVLGSRPQAGPALISLGMLALGKDKEKAFQYFQKAQATDPGHAGPALMWMAIVRDQQKEAAEADELFQQALGELRPISKDKVTALQLYTAFLQRQGRNDEAKQ